MHNAPKPKLEDLPTKAQLRRASIVAGIGAVAVGLAVVMPAELGQDPTGLGSVLNLTEMGEIKQQLAEQAVADALLHGNDEASSLMNGIFGRFVSNAQTQEEWRDEITFTLAPGEWTETKATMQEGATLFYAWVADGGRINFDFHAHAGGDEVTYKKGRGRSFDRGSVETPFAGDHGWFWRNRDKSDVTVTLQLRGDYIAIVRGK